MRASALPECPVDPYVDHNGVLLNLLGKVSREELRAAEADLATVRQIQLVEHDLIAHTRDLAELKGLHGHLFQDIYNWAGQPRTMDIRRNGDSADFGQWQMIDRSSNFLFAELHEQKYLRGLLRRDFVEGLVHFYDGLNYIHPFRDGNGRTQRLFWSRVSAQAGWLLDWRPVYGELLDNVSRMAREGNDSRPLREALERCVSPLPG